MNSNLPVESDLAERDKRERKSQNRVRFCLTNLVFLFFLVFGFICIRFFTLCWNQTATAWLWALAALALGIFVGLLFGIPRIRQPSTDKDKQTDSHSNDQPDNYQPEINNNLIEVADWLTKIIVGLGLVELSSLPSKLKVAALPLATCLGGDCAMAKAVSIIIFFSVSGFLIGYIDARTIIAVLFRNSDDLVLEKEKEWKQFVIKLTEKKALETKEDLGEESKKLAEGISAAAAALVQPNEIYRKQALRGLLDVLKSFPTNRTAAMFAGRLFRSLNEPTNAIQILNDTIKNRRAANLPANKDDAALLFNIACYSNLLAEAALKAGNENDAENHRKTAWENLKSSCQLDPQNKEDAAKDDDLKTLFKPNTRDLNVL